VTRLIYFSNVSENTKRFVAKLGEPATRIGVLPTDAPVIATEPYVLIVPTYGLGNDGKAVPKQVLKFLAIAENRELLRGVVGAGNTNFGSDYGMAARKIAAKCGVPLLHRFEILGTTDDVRVVLERMEIVL
jgi:protein involved in ribonucleotide reduction